MIRSVIRPQGDDGFSLVEVIAAMAILFIASTAILYGALAAQRLSGDSRARIIATNLAAEQIDRSQALPLSALDALSTQNQTATVDGRAYQVLTNAVWQPRTGTGSACDSGSGTSFAFKRVSVRVTWADMGATEPVRSDTVIAPGVGSFDPTRGNIAVRVRNADGTPAELVTITVTGPEAAIAMTDETGCAFFYQLAAGTTYTVTATGSGRVDVLGTTSPSRSNVDVTAGTTTPLQFDYDRAAGVRLLAPAEHGVPSSVAVALGHADLPPPGHRASAGSAWPKTLSGLYPFTGGYRVWLGTCFDADPEAVIDQNGTVVSYWAGEAAPAPVAAAVAGVVSDVPFTGARITVVVTDDGEPQPGQQVRLTRPAVAGCPAGETHVLGTTDAQGRVSATVPYGTTWSISVGSNTVATERLAPNGTYPVTVTVEGD